VALALKDLGLHEGSIGLVGHHVFLANHERIIFDVLGRRLDWVIADDILIELRSIKSDAEIVLMRKAAEVGVGWMSSMLDAAVPGATEGQVAGAGLAYMAEHGGIPADIDIASGPFASQLKSHFALPSWDTTRLLEAGDLFHVDGWGSVGGYFTDTARTTVVGGTPTGERLEIIEGSIAIVEDLLSFIRSGVRASEVNARGQALMRDLGFDRLFADPHGGKAMPDGRTPHFQIWPYFGHGLGLGLEAPWLTIENDVVLKPNMCFAIEIYLNARNGEVAGFEENIVVREGLEPENLTRTMRPRWWQ